MTAGHAASATDSGDTDGSGTGASSTERDGRAGSDTDSGSGIGTGADRPGDGTEAGGARDGESGETGEAGEACETGKAGDHGPADDADEETDWTEEDEDEAGWTEEDDDRTAETLSWLRRKRRAHRRQQGRDLAVLLYCLLLAGLGYGSSFVLQFLRELEGGPGYGGFGTDLQRGLPAAFTTLTVALAVVAARDALWRGPVVLPGPAVGWLLSQPVRRAAVLRPWFRLSAGLALLPGVLVGTAGAAVLRVTGLAPIGWALLAVLPAALCLPLLAVTLGMAVERRPELVRTVRRFTAPAVLVVGALAGQTALAATGHRVAALEGIELWSGPWGWAAQPVVRAAGGSAPGWPAAVTLLAAGTVAAVLQAYRDAALVPTAQLRSRAATATTVSSVMWSLELRAAKLAMLEAGGGEPTRRIHLRPPHGRLGRYLVVVWRDLLTLLRTPGRLGRAAVWAACGAATAGLGVDLGGERRVVGLVLGLLSGYLAVGTLAEPARLETDDVRRAAWSPFRFRTLMLHHAIVPAVLGTLLGLLAAVPFAIAGSPGALLLMPLCAVPFTAASLFGACRGPARTQLMLLGGSSPMGSPGPLIFLAWYAAGPLISVTGLTLVLDSALKHGMDAAAGQVAMTAAALSAALLFMMTLSADKLIRH